MPGALGFERRGMPYRQMLKMQPSERHELQAERKKTRQLVAVDLIAAAG
jgi:hypothetical protein